MHSTDLFVGGVGVSIGVAFLGAALLNWNWCFETPKGKWLAERMGRTGARIFFAGLGLALVALGVATALGIANR